MNFLELAKERYSVRKFDSREVEAEKIELILEAGRIAPTAENFQPQRILVLNSKESLDKLKDCSHCHYNAPLAMIICYDNRVSSKRSGYGYEAKDMGEQDASIVTTQMMLEITNLGLGSTWVAYFNEAAVRTAFSIPEYVVPVALLTIGYPSEKSKPSPLHFKRLDRNETVFYNKF